MIDDKDDPPATTIDLRDPHAIVVIRADPLLDLFEQIEVARGDSDVRAVLHDALYERLCEKYTAAIALADELARSRRSPFVVLFRRTVDSGIFVVQSIGTGFGTRLSPAMTDGRAEAIHAAVTRVELEVGDAVGTYVADPL